MVDLHPIIAIKQRTSEKFRRVDPGREIPALFEYIILLS